MNSIQLILLRLEAGTKDNLVWTFYTKINTPILQVKEINFSNIFQSIMSTNFEIVAPK